VHININHFVVRSNKWLSHQLGNADVAVQMLGFLYILRS
jgi:hypothetical protein